MEWGVILSFVGALGGLEGIKYLLNRRANSRLAEVAATSAEQNLMQETITFLQTQLIEKEKRFAEQTDRLRKIQDELFSEQKLRLAAELELALKRCEVRNCANRKPQNGY